MKTAYFQYRCRRCGELVIDGSAYGVLALNLLEDAVSGGANEPLTVKMAKVIECACAQSNGGGRSVGDLVGFQVGENQ